VKEFLAQNVEMLAGAAYAVFVAWLVLEAVIWQRQKLGPSAPAGRAGWRHACVAAVGVVERMEKARALAFFIVGAIVMVGGFLFVELGLVR
jgi:hypothetical protein